MFEMANQLTSLYHAMFRADLDKRHQEKQRLEEERRRENMDRLRRDMERSGGETVVLNTGLKDREARTSRSMLDEEDEEMDDDDGDDYDLGIDTEEEDAIDEDEDEEVDKFGF